MLFFSILLKQNPYTSEDYFNSYFYLGFLILIFFSFKKYFSNFEEYNSRLKTKFVKQENIVEVQKTLEKLSPYYKNLNNKLKRKFLRRLHIFLNMKNFVPRNCERNSTLNLLISAIAVQLTFGLNNFSIFTFNRILIYPDIYYNKIRGVYHKGEVNIRHRIIILSAKHFLEGINNPNDGINLGLHEMAHALNVDKFETNNSNFIRNFNNWKVVALKEMEIIKKSRSHFMRKYGSKNIHEMFAVSTENFFERPEEFNKRLPLLYNKMCILYKQNPLIGSNPIS